MTLPGMRERTVRIGSAGKSFSLTGWKVGLRDRGPRTDEGHRQDPSVHDLHHAAQPAVGAATGLRLGDGYFSGLAADMQRKRDRLAQALSDIGFDVLPAHGTYFVTTDFRPLGFNGTDEDFCRHITVKPGSPPSRSAPFTTPLSGRRATWRASVFVSMTRRWITRSIDWTAFSKVIPID